MRVGRLPFTKKRSEEGEGGAGRLVGGRKLAEAQRDHRSKTETNQGRRSDSQARRILLAKKKMRGGHTGVTFFWAETKRA